MRCSPAPLNGTGALAVRVDRPAADSVVARIVAMVEQASADQGEAPSCSSRRSSSATRSAWSSRRSRCSRSRWLLGAAFQPTLLRAMTFMIVASPCAVVLATMPPLLAAIANAGRHGVLVKSAVAHGAARHGRRGRVRQDRHADRRHAPGGRRRACPVPAWPRSEVLPLAAAAEQPSEHPLGRAIVRPPASAACPPQRPGFAAPPGRGVDRDRRRPSGRGRVARLLRRPPPQPRRSRDARAVVDGSRTPGTPPSSSSSTACRSRCSGWPTGLATGRRRGRRLAPARPGAAGPAHRRQRSAPPALAGEVGITEVRAGLLPEDKADGGRRPAGAGPAGGCWSATASTTPPRWRRARRGRDGSQRLRPGAGDL